MKSPVQALMEEYGAPLTRDEYLKWSNLGKGTKVSPEEEAELPTRFAYPTITHDTMPEPHFGQKAKAKINGPAKADKPAGVLEKPPKVTVHHFNGKVMKTADDKPFNNNDITIGGDNPEVRDENSAPATRLPKGVILDKSNPPAIGAGQDPTRQF